MLFNTVPGKRLRNAARCTLLLGAFVSLLSASAFAATSVTLAWDASTSTNIAGYRIYYGTTPHSYTGNLNVGAATSGTLSNLTAGATYYFAATAYDNNSLESDFSNEVSFTNTVQAAPTIVLTSPANGSTFTAPVNIALAASATANGHSLTKVQFYRGSTLIGEDATAPYALTWSGVSAGTYSLTARLVYDSGAIVTSTPATSVVVAAAKPANTAPTISPIANQTTPTSTPTDPIAFTIQDAETNAASLQLSAASANASLVSTNDIVFGGTGGDRTLVVTPVAGATGSVQITVFVSDGILQTNTTFTLSIQDGVTPIRLVSSANSANNNVAASTDTSSYNGLFYEGDAVRPDSAGSFTVSVNARGKYTGRLQFGGKRYSFSGTVDGDGNATNSVTRKGLAPLLVDFHLGGSHGEQITGHVSDGTWTARLAGDLAEFGKASAAPFAGNYTLVMPGYETNSALPAGASSGTLKVDSAGKIKFVGTLADGTKVSQSAPVARNGLWPLYASLYAGKGSLMSWISFAANTNSDLSGQVIWLKQPGAKSKYYTGGFTADCPAFGSSYKASDPILNLPAAHLLFSGGSLTADITNSITIGAKNKVTTEGKNLKLTFSAATGTFKGTYASPAGGKPVSFSGAVFQKLNSAYGALYGSGDQTSEVRLSE